MIIMLINDHHNCDNDHACDQNIKSFLKKIIKNVTTKTEGGDHDDDDQGRSD